MTRIQASSICGILFLCTSMVAGVYAQWNNDFYSGVVQPSLQTAPRAGTPAPVKQSDEAVLRQTGVEAVLFAVNDYKEHGVLENLHGCNNDIRLMLDWLHAVNVEDGSISVMSDETTLSDRLPTRENLMTELSHKAAIPCERLIVVIACHGISVQGKSFLCPRDTLSIEMTETNESDLLSEAQTNNLVSVISILDLLKGAKAKDVLLILDACRNSDEQTGFMREFSDLLKDNDSSFKKSIGTFAVITSCSFGQSALEIYSKDEKAHGAFMLYFADGLSGRADYAACYDGQVSLIEAYNYAYSNVSAEALRRNRAQTPEIFMSSSGGNMTLADYAVLPKVENETDLQFLMRTGMILCDNRRVKSANQVGLEMMDCILSNVPNNTLACSLRGSVHRKLGNYEEALLDMNAIGQKFQIYADPKSDDNLTLKADPGSDGTRSEEVKVHRDSLLTITKIQGDDFYVSEIDNVSLGDRAGWISRDSVTWDRNRANSILPTTQMQTQIRTVSNSALNSGPMPFGGNTTGGKSPVLPMNGMFGI